MASPGFRNVSMKTEFDRLAPKPRKLQKWLFEQDVVLSMPVLVSRQEFFQWSQYRRFQKIWAFGSTCSMDDVFVKLYIVAVVMKAPIGHIYSPS